MAQFKFSKALNPVETSFTATDKDDQNPITFKLRPVDTGFAFDASRWISYVKERMVNEANELQFQLGAQRIVGWDGVTDESGNSVPFSADNMAAFTRMVQGIPYIMRVGEETLIELEALPRPNSELPSENAEGMKPEAKMNCEATVIPGEPTEEASETSTETP